MPLPDNTLVISGVVFVLILGSFFFFVKNYCDKKLTSGLKDIRKKIMRDINKSNAAYAEEINNHRRQSKRKYINDDDSVVEAGGSGGDNEYAECDSDEDEDE
jgi:hypothetical protein